VRLERLTAGVVTAALIAALIAFSSLGPKNYAVVVLVWIAINAVLAAGVRFVMLIGEVNIAAGTFFGIGAYAAALLTTRTGVPLPLALLAGALAAMAAGAFVGWVTLRTKGAYFFLIMFSFAEIMRLAATQTLAIGGNDGIIGIFPPRELAPWFPTVIVVVCSGCLVALWAAERSILGKLFAAIRSNDRIVQTVGINVLGLKITCLALASLVTGLAGGLQAHLNGVIGPNDFTVALGVYALAYSKIGGEAHVIGAVMGAAFLTIVGQYTAGFNNLELILFGGAIVLTMVLFPRGLLGLVWVLQSASSADRRARVR